MNGKYTADDGTEYTIKFDVTYEYAADISKIKLADGDNKMKFSSDNELRSITMGGVEYGKDWGKAGHYDKDFNSISTKDMKPGDSKDKYRWLEGKTAYYTTGRESVMGRSAYNRSYQAIVHGLMPVISSIRSAASATL
jgi:hypothetical protein